MSLVYITFHDENINDIEKPTSAEEHFKFPKYVSIHRQSVKSPHVNQIECQGKKLISASSKYSHKTLGYAETPLDEPSKFLKKNGGIKWQRLNDHVCPPSLGLPPIPSKLDYHPKGDKVNFIRKNINRVKTATPQRVTPKYVDTPQGERHNLDGTGLVPKYVLSRKFGKTPAYLKGMRKAFEENKCNNNKKPAYSGRGVQALSNSDRNAILMGLRDNHAELEKTYQLLPIFTDTQSKKQRKSKLEKELKRLEQDILLLESNPVILICDD